jgi:hypothetical protein
VWVSKWTLAWLFPHAHVDVDDDAKNHALAPPSEAWHVLINPTWDFFPRWAINLLSWHIHQKMGDPNIC